MKIDVTQVLYGIDGEALKEPGKDGMEEITLRKVMCAALMFPAQTDTGEKKAEAWNLAMRIQASDEVALKAEEVAVVKKKIGDNMNAVVVGPAWLILDPEAMAVAEADAKDAEAAE